jgi:hypothetical protein
MLLMNLPLLMFERLPLCRYKLDGQAGNTHRATAASQIVAVDAQLINLAVRRRVLIFVP